MSCGNLDDVHNVIVNIPPNEEVKHILIHVGVNDLDDKDHTHVFNEMRHLLTQIRRMFKNIRMVVSEATPRNASRDKEVVEYNKLLHEYVKGIDDITITQHNSLRDWRMFSDSKHIKSGKIAKFAANLIFALKRIYDISSKRELFTTNNHHHKSTLPHPKPLMSLNPTPPRGIDSQNNSLHPLTSASSGP